MQRQQMLLVLFFFFVQVENPFGAAYAQDTLTVEQAVQRVIQNHPAVVQANQDVYASEARVLQAETAKLPNAGLDVLYTRIGPVPQLYFPGLGDFKLYPENNYDAHIGGGYTVYDFGKANAAINATQSRVQSARDAVAITKSGLAYQTIRTFYAILFLEKSIHVTDEQIDALNQHLLTTQKKVESGTATSFDVLTTQVRVAAAQNQKVELENALHQQQIVLHQLLGIPAEQQVQLRGEFVMTPVSLNTDSLTQQAFTQREELKLARDAEQSAELQYKAVSFSAMPSLQANLAYGVKNGYIPNLDVLRGNWVAGVQLQVPIYEGSRTDHQEEEAHANILAEQAHVTDTERQVRSDVERAVSDIRAALNKLQISNLQVEQAKEAVSIARKRYETGSVTNLDLLDAETAESAAQLGSVQSLYNYVLSVYELKRATGEELF
jgi:outer membrane protein